MKTAQKRKGLSPPTRGSPVRQEVHLRVVGSIPAHAGEPDCTMSWSEPVRVYPRPRGGAAHSMTCLRMFPGLSPPTRGSPLDFDPTDAPDGSIPAHAGEPFFIATSATEIGVYPRPRGGAASNVLARLGNGGLSPPTRGSPSFLVFRRDQCRSIPAHAGEPESDSAMGTINRVYPRPRGGATRSPQAHAMDSGLSPPTRGSRGHSSGKIINPWSIPAHAGEPPRTAPRRLYARVYPRPRGGAGPAGDEPKPPKGLSPPTRGSPRPEAQAWTKWRSIPAHAGEPRGSGDPAGWDRVYPRPRGGAAHWWGKIRFLFGLSPPTRGSPKEKPHETDKRRSIPAHAGEPCHPLASLGVQEVYPRPRGGAAP